MALTKGVNNILNNDNLNYVSQFWELHKLCKKQNSENKVRTQEQMSEIAAEIINNDLVSKNDKFYNFYKKYKNGETVENKFGKKLYFKLGE